MHEAGAVPPQSAEVAPAEPIVPASTPGALASRELLRELCETTRLAGTRASQVAAHQVARRLEAAGWRAELEPRVVMLTYPRRTEIAVFDGDATTPLSTRIDSFDPDRVPTGDVPLYNAWSASGRVRGPVVDAGRGLRADFERLRSAGVELAGTVALCRYGGCYRGIKVDLAAQYGCAAVLLWSDPKSDGAGRGPTWPTGPWKPAHEAQRGSISPMGRTPGDPSTPGWPSPRPGESARRLTDAELAEALPRIPCAPIGAAEAELLLAELGPRSFLDEDGRTVEEPIGPGPRQALVDIHAPRELRTIWNVIGTLAGEQDEFVLAGAHRDAWVHGANDNASGCVVLLRTAQELGARARDGWKPARTIRLAFWDAEEFGLIGSTEWGEAHADELRARCVAYVNSDVAASGPKFGGASGTPGMLGSLEPVLRRVTGVAGQPLWDEWIARTPDPDLSLPGSGSDFAVFVHHLGIPFVEVGFGGNGGGQYHTGFDDVPVVERFLDPGYVGHELSAKLHVDLLVELAQRGHAAFDGREAALRMQREALALMVEAGADAALAAVANQLAVAFGETAEALREHPDAGRTWLRDLAIEAGIPGREWHKNVLWTSGLEDGYGAETFPTLRAVRGGGAERSNAAAAPILAGLARIRAAAAPESAAAER
jgi:N-acetylated-alpha-linked acidic dipeptidase